MIILPFSAFPQQDLPDLDERPVSATITEASAADRNREVCIFSLPLFHLSENLPYGWLFNIAMEYPL